MLWISLKLGLSSGFLFRHCITTAYTSPGQLRGLGGRMWYPLSWYRWARFSKTWSLFSWASGWHWEREKTSQRVIPKAWVSLRIDHKRFRGEKENIQYGLEKAHCIGNNKKWPSNLSHHSLIYRQRNDAQSPPSSPLYNHKSDRFLYISFACQTYPFWRENWSAAATAAVPPTMQGHKSLPPSSVGYRHGMDPFSDCYLIFQKCASPFFPSLLPQSSQDCLRRGTQKNPHDSWSCYGQLFRPFT